MQVVAADNEGALHAVLLHNAAENAAADGDIRSERAFVVDVLALYGLTGNLEAKPRRFPEPETTLAARGLAFRHAALAIARLSMCTRGSACGCA